MAGFGAVVSLQQTIERILQSSRISLVSQCPKILRRAYWELDSLRKILERLDSISPSKSRKKVNALDEQIKEAAWRFEDFLESHLSDQILSHHFERDSDRVLLFSIDLRNGVGSFIEMVNDMKNKYLYELENMPPVEDDELSAVNDSSSSSSFGGMKAKVVGFSDLFTQLKLLILLGSQSAFHSLVGMPGSGKTTIAEKLFQDPEALRLFHHRVWITVGRKYELNEIVRRILAQLDPHIDEIPECNYSFNPDLRWFGRRATHDEEKIREYMRGSRSLIVLDNVWDTELIDYLKPHLPVENEGVIRILLTTNLDSVVGNRK